MTNYEQRAVEMVKQLVPNCNKIEFKADIGDTSYRITFFVWIDGERRQCYELVDNGIIDEQKMDNLFTSYVDFIRKGEGYKKGEPNIVSFET
jgi:hypothetical protein